MCMIEDRGLGVDVDGYDFIGRGDGGRVLYLSTDAASNVEFRCDRMPRLPDLVFGANRPGLDAAREPATTPPSLSAN